MIRIDGIDSLTNFQKNVKTIVGKLEESKQPMVLTVNGKAKLVVQDAQAYQDMVEELDRSRFLAAVQKGIDQAQAGKVRTADESFKDMKAKYDL